MPTVYSYARSLLDRRRLAGLTLLVIAFAVIESSGHAAVAATIDTASPEDLTQNRRRPGHRTV